LKTGGAFDNERYSDFLKWHFIAQNNFPLSSKSMIHEPQTGRVCEPHLLKKKTSQNTDGFIFEFLIVALY
jgi:hypothetical protein